MTEQSRQLISRIKDKLPKFMVPGFNTIISENQDKIWFDHFIYIYDEYIKDAEAQGVKPITPAAALGEYKNKMEQDLNNFRNWEKENCIEQVDTVITEDGTGVPVYGYSDAEETTQDEVFDDSDKVSECGTPIEATLDVLSLVFDTVDGELEAEGESEKPEEEPIDII